MLPFGIGFSEILVILVVFLLVVGPKRLPDVAKTAGKALRMLRKAGRDLRETIDTEEIRKQVYQPIRQWERAQQEEEAAEILEEEKARKAKIAKAKPAAAKPKPAALIEAPAAADTPAAPGADPAAPATPHTPVEAAADLDEEDIDEGPAIVPRTALGGGAPLWSPIAADPTPLDPQGKDRGPEEPG